MRRGLLCLVVATVAGALAVKSTSLAALGLLVAVVPVLALAASAPLSTLAVLLVACTQLTRGRFPLGSFHFLPEHVALLAFGGALLARRPAVLLRRATAYEATLIAWIAWNAAVSVLYSVDLGKSLAIVAWLGLAWLVLWSIRGYLLADPVGRERIVRTGIVIASVLGGVAFVLWVVALLGGTSLGVQPEYVTGKVAAKGLALEANFLGSQELCWLFIVIRRRTLFGTRAPAWQVAGMVLGIVASMSRAVWIAAIVVVVGGLLVTRMTQRPRDARGSDESRLLRQAAFAAVLLSAVVLGLGTPVAQKFRAGLDFQSSTGQSRVADWKAAWSDITSSGEYLTGLGTNSYGQRHASPTLKNQPGYLGNLPLTVLYDSGMVGVVLFCGAMTGVVLRGRNPRSRLLNVIFVVSLMIVGAATSPVWFGFVWVTIAIIDTDPNDALTPSVEGEGLTEALAGAPGSLGR